MLNTRPVRALILSLGLLLASTPALAEPAAPDLTGVGDAATQLALDLTPVPAGMGALFVPSASRPNLEPPVHVLVGDERVATALTGTRIPLPPGEYTVRIGHGPTEWRPTRQVTVVAGQTAVVDAFFGSLRVTAIDELDRVQAEHYILVSEDGQQVYGPEKTSDSAAYRTTRTWIVAPGRYHLILGKRASRKTDRVALPIDAGEQLEYRLVVEGGHLVRTEFGERALQARDERWRIDWVVGGSFGLDRAKGELSGFSGDAMRLGAFTRLEGGFDSGNHLALGRLSLDESWVGVEHSIGRGLPFQKLTDIVQAELFYNYRLGAILGPYVTARARTAFFPTRIHSEEAVTVTVAEPEGGNRQFELAADTKLTLMSAFSPTIFQEAVGLGLTFWDNDVFTLTARAGVAMRQSIYGDDSLYIIRSRDGVLELGELANRKRVGGEVAASMRLRLGDFITVQSNFDSFVSYDEIAGNEKFRPVFYWDSTVGLALGAWASLVYQITLHRDDTRIEELQMRQSLNLRFHHSIF
ncbi:MAG: hypothetical protein R3F39_18285 [Myxococcota bacterium]